MRRHVPVLFSVGNSFKILSWIFLLNLKDLSKIVSLRLRAHSSWSLLPPRLRLKLTRLWPYCFDSITNLRSMICIIPFVFPTCFLFTFILNPLQGHCLQNSKSFLGGSHFQLSAVRFKTSSSWRVCIQVFHRMGPDVLGATRNRQKNHKPKCFISFEMYFIPFGILFNFFWYKSDCFICFEMLW